MIRQVTKPIIHDILRRNKSKSTRKPTEFEEMADFLYKKISPKVAITLTFKKNMHGASIGPNVMKQVCRLFLNRINHKTYGRHAVRRKGFTLGVITAFGRGPYDDHPHSHMALTVPPKYSTAEFMRTATQIALSTRGVGRQFRVIECRDWGWVRYDLDPTKHEWVPELTHEAVCPID